MWPKIISVLATMVLLALVTVLAIRGGLPATGPIGGTLQVAAILLVLWARFTFGFRSFHFAANPTQGPLVTSGPYHYVRNPIYAAAWLFIWVGAAAHWSAENAALAAAVAFTLVLRIACEENLLRAAYPEYEDYAKRTKRLIPFWV
jgi:protein-S-isoprenylcysteine O-methyltransferase Ste14